jgi:hypothetical protein
MLFLPPLGGRADPAAGHSSYSQAGAADGIKAVTGLLCWRDFHPLEWQLASLLWRIRRATGIETDLLRIQAEILRERAQTAQQQAGESGRPRPTHSIWSANPTSARDL